jgi:hypothetical protein
MKTEKSIALLARLEMKTEEHLAVAVRTFQNLDDERLLRPSSQGGWSIAQCLDHLNRYGNFYLPQIKLAIEKSQTAHEHFKNGWFGNYFTNMMDPAAGKKYKAFREYIPPSDVPARETVAEFIQQQETLLVYLRRAAKADLNVRVPVSITSLVKLKLGDVFQFLIMHNERHMQQAKRNS